jgi:hypothetical protein
MIFSINTVVIPTVLLFSLLLFITSKRVYLRVRERSPLALAYLYLLSFAFWWISPFFPSRWRDNPFQGNSLVVAVLVGCALSFVAFRFLLGLKWTEAALGLASLLMAHVIMVTAKLFLLSSYSFQGGLERVVTGMRTYGEIKNLMSWAWREAGVVFLVFLVIFRLFSERDEAGDLMSSPLWHFSAWISAMVLWNLFWVYEVIFDIPVFLQRYFLIYILQIFLITVLCVPFFSRINRVPLPVAGRMAWSFFFANLAGLGFRLMLLFGGAFH